MSDLDNLLARRRQAVATAEFLAEFGHDQDDNTEMWRQRYLGETARSLAVLEYLFTPGATVEGALHVIQQRTATHGS